MHRAAPLSLVLFVSGAFTSFAGCVESTTYLPPPPAAPALRLPMNNAYWGSVHTGKLAPRFAWEAAISDGSHPITYQLQFSQDASFASDVTTIETAETSHQVESALPVSTSAPVGARYFWRVRACLTPKTCSDYSRPWYLNLGRVIKDYNGDGYSDLAVGAPGNDSLFSEAGRVFVYFGGAGTTLDATPDGRVISGLEAAEMQRAGDVLATAGDVNGDGFADLALGTPSTAMSPLGHAFLYYGGAGMTFDDKSDVTLSSGTAGDHFGTAVGGLGDVNGDGFDDLFVVSNPDSPDPGRVDVYFGSAGSRINGKVDGALEHRPYVGSVSAGDLDGDGFTEVVVGVPGDTSAGDAAGAAYIYRGAAGEMLDVKDDVMVPGRGSYDGYGTGVGIAGDINGDGFADLLIGNRRDEDNGGGRSGSADVFLGRSGALSAVPAATLSGNTPTGNDGFGMTCAGVGDVNGDGYDDFVIGASRTDDGAVNDLGKAYLYFGVGGAAVDTTPDASILGASEFSFFARLVSGGDVNGDGFSDVSIAAAGHNGSRGRVDVYLGASGSSFSSSPASSLFGALSNDEFGKGMARRCSHRVRAVRKRHLARARF